jgi:hypothetical protein
MTKNKFEIITSIDEYVDQIITENKMKLFSKYVRSKKVEFETSFIKYGPRETLIKSKTKSRYEQHIWDRHYSCRNQQQFKCSCPDFRYNSNDQTEPCKHLFALIEKYQSKRETCKDLQVEEVAMHLEIPVHHFDVIDGEYYISDYQLPNLNRATSILLLARTNILFEMDKIKSKWNDDEQADAHIFVNQEFDMRLFIIFR